MKFLLEASGISDFIKMNSDTPYDKLNSDQRHKFIFDWLKERDNYSTLKPAQASIVNLIKENNWNTDFLDYLDKINNVKLTDNIINTIGTLLIAKKIPSADRDWLYKSDLYDRNESDVLFTIKALTFADNPSIQTNEKGENKYFDENNPLKISDFIENGKIKTAAEIRDIINSKQTKGFSGNGSNSRSNIKQKLRDAGITKSESEIDKNMDSAEEIIKNDLVSALVNFGLKENNARQLVQDNYTNEKAFEELLRDMLRGLGRGA